MLYFHIAIVLSAVALVAKADSDQQKVAQAVDSARSTSIPSDSCCLSTSSNDDTTEYKLRCYYSTALTQADVDSKFAAFKAAFIAAAGALGSSCTERITHSADLKTITIIICCDGLSGSDSGSGSMCKWKWW